MEKKLLRAGYLAIPLVHNSGLSLNPQPNLLLVESIGGSDMATLPVLGEVMCRESYYRFVYREILLANAELMRPEEIREVVYESGIQWVPIPIVPALNSYELLSQYKQEVNSMLSLFTFRGCLEGFSVQIDSNVLNQILQS